jgi:hypothetical protein
MKGGVTMRNFKIKASVVGALVVLASFAGAFPAFATDPTPPDTGTLVGSLISNIGDSLADMWTAVLANPWVLFFIVLGPAVGIAAAALSRGGHAGEKLVRRAGR